VQFGLTTFPTDYSMDVCELARAAEAGGFDSLWFPEHTHIPTSRLSPWPGGPDLPREYSHTLDAFVGLAACASVTTTLGLGLGICLLVERDPITTAKAVATLDHLSGGRVLFGVGAGWNREEMENHGTEFATRHTLLQERVEAMKEIWTKDEAEYHGRFVDFDPLWSWPKPVQKPHPPILVGGHGPKVLERVVAYADEWLPIPVRETDLAGRIQELHRLAADHGRGSIGVTVFLGPRDMSELERYEQAGVGRVIFGLPSTGADVVLPLVEECATLMKSFS
jgi:probable F420-dependent oxidoreductase